MNLGVPRELKVSGRMLMTGIFKEPVDGRVAVGEMGLEGDVQVDRRVHGGRDQAVYAYAIEDVEFWEEELGRDLGPGFFGENLTVRGIDLSNSVAGERWEVGDAVLEVTFPRQPCMKLQTKVGEPGFVKRFAKAGRPGRYMSVVSPGEVGAGDPVRLVAAD